MGVGFWVLGVRKRDTISPQHPTPNTQHPTMTFLEMLILSIVQGIGEFLPISSSGHINVVNYWLERINNTVIDEPLLVNICLHIGTLFSILVVFYKRIITLLTKDARAIALIVVACIPVVIVGIPMEKYYRWLLESPVLTGFCFIGTAFLLLYAAKKQKTETGDKLYSEMSYRDALMIGLFQTCAILPGFSRSGFTIVGGLLQKLRRDEAATFSFLIAIPVIGGVGLLKTVELIRKPTPGLMDDLPVYLFGLVMSFLIGVVSLIWLMKWLQKGKLHYFAYWLLFLGPFTILMALVFPASKTSAPSSPEHVPAVAVSSSQKSPKILPKILEAQTQKELEMKERNQSPEQTTEQTTLQLNQEIVRRWNEADEKKNSSQTSDNSESNLSQFLNEEETEDYDDYEDEIVNELPPEMLRPLIDCPGERLISLDETSPIWLDRDRTQVVLAGHICLREGMLELFACRKGSKEHESIVSLEIKPFLVHAALLAIGAEPGKPAQFSPQFEPAEGPEIEIDVLWIDSDGVEHRCKSQQLIAKIDYESEEQGQAPEEMSVPFVFTGSFFRTFEEPDGRKISVYMADATGEIFGLSNFPASILDIPIRSSDSNDELLFQPYTDRIPEIGTPVTLIMSLKRKE